MEDGHVTDIDLSYHLPTNKQIKIMKRDKCLKVFEMAKNIEKHEFLSSLYG